MAEQAHLLNIYSVPAQITASQDTNLKNFLKNDGFTLDTVPDQNFYSYFIIQRILHGITGSSRGTSNQVIKKIEYLQASITFARKRFPDYGLEEQVTLCAMLFIELFVKGEEDFLMALQGLTSIVSIKGESLGLDFQFSEDELNSMYPIRGDIDLNFGPVWTRKLHMTITALVRMYQINPEDTIQLFSQEIHGPVLFHALYIISGGNFPIDGVR